METKGDLLLSIGWDWSLNAVVMMESDRAKKEDLACAWVKVENINVVKTLIRMLSERMHQLVKSMVNWNI